MARSKVSVVQLDGGLHGVQVAERATYQSNGVDSCRDPDTCGCGWDDELQFIMWNLYSFQLGRKTQIGKTVRVAQAVCERPKANLGIQYLITTGSILIRYDNGDVHNRLNRCRSI
jgi:hypothetical protein